MISREGLFQQAAVAFRADAGVGDFGDEC